MKVTVEVRGLEQLKAELARLAAAVQSNGRATALSHGEAPEILELRRRIAYAPGSMRWRQVRRSAPALVAWVCAG